jgi:hypothetical protein
MSRLLIKGMLVLLVAGIFMTAFPMGASALTVPDPDIDVDPINPVTKTSEIIDRISKIMMIIATGVLVIALIIGAIMYMTAGGDPEKAKSARSMIINGVIGAVILFAIAFIIGLAQGIGTNVLGS